MPPSPFYFVLYYSNHPYLSTWVINLSSTTSTSQTPVRLITDPPGSTKHKITSDSMPSNRTWDILVMVKTDEPSNDTANEDNSTAAPAPYTRLDFGQNLAPAEAQKNLMVWLTTNRAPKADLSNYHIDSEITSFPGPSQKIELRMKAGGKADDTDWDAAELFRVDLKPGKESEHPLIVATLFQKTGGDTLSSSIVRTNAVGLWSWTRNALRAAAESKESQYTILKIYAWKDPDRKTARSMLEHRFDSLTVHPPEETGRTRDDPRSQPTGHTRRVTRDSDRDGRDSSPPLRSHDSWRPQ